MIRTRIAALLILLLSCQVVLHAQVDKDQRRQYAWMLGLRRQLLEACISMPVAEQKAVAQALAESGNGNPFLPMVKAMAVAQGVDADADWLFANSLMLFAMPEVVDPLVFAEEAVTVYAPRSMPASAKENFAVEVRDGEGELCWQGNIHEDTDLSSLRSMACKIMVPVAELANGAYLVRVHNKQGVDLSGSFHVLRAYKQRVLTLFQGFEKLKADLSPLQRAMLEGAIWPVQRVWEGEPGSGSMTALRELQQAETVLQNLTDKKPALDGLSGWVQIGLPVEEAKNYPKKGPQHTLRLALRLPKTPAPRPMLLFIPGAPSWNVQDHRPSSPRYTAPDFLASDLRMLDFDAKDEALLVIMESPGRLPSSGMALDAARKHLPGLLPVAKGEVVVVAERQAAGGVFSDLMLESDPMLALVLVNGVGLMNQYVFAHLEHKPVLGVPGLGHPATKSLQRLQKYLHGRDAGKEFKIMQPLPWCLALPMALPEISKLLPKPAGE